MKISKINIEKEFEYKLVESQCFCESLLLIEISTEVEYDFLKIWNSCKLMIWNRYPESIFMVYNGKVLFEQDWEKCAFFIKSSTLRSFMIKFELSYTNTIKLLSPVINNKLRTNQLNPISSVMAHVYSFENLLK